MMNDVLIWKKSAMVYATEKFLCVRTQSGYRLALIDPTVEQYLLSPDVSDEMLGTVIKNAVNQSRLLSLDEMAALRASSSARYESWVDGLITAYEYSSRKTLFKKMRNCRVVLLNDSLTIFPSHHDKLEGWGRTKDDGIEDVVVPESSSASELGSGLRLALSRCTGMGATR